MKNVKEYQHKQEKGRVLSRMIFTRQIINVTCKLYDDVPIITV